MWLHVVQASGASYERGKPRESASEIASLIFLSASDPHGPVSNLFLPIQILSLSAKPRVLVASIWDGARVDVGVDDALLVPDFSQQ